MKNIVVIILMIFGTLNAQYSKIQLKSLNKVELINRLIIDDNSLNVDDLNKQTRRYLISLFNTVAEKPEKKVSRAIIKKRVERIPITESKIEEIHCEGIIENPIDKNQTSIETTTINKEYSLKNRLAKTTIVTTSACIPILTLCMYIYNSSFNDNTQIIANSEQIWPIFKIGATNTFDEIISSFLIIYEKLPF